MTTRVLRTAFAALLALATIAPIQPALAAPSASGATQATWAAVRAATAKYHDLNVAIADGYGLFPGCFTDAAGGMGVHYVKFSSVADGAVDPLQPEALVYEPQTDGSMALVAVEYVQIAATWTGGTAPSVFGKSLVFTPSPNEFGLPDFYELHVWLWRPNPSGMFEEWNPAVHCPA